MPASKASTAFKYSVPVRVRRPKLEILPSLAYLDIEKLTKASSATVELGSFQSTVCKQNVSAVIQKGKVVGLHLEGCSKSEPQTPELSRLLKVARKQLNGSAAPPRFRPVPVIDFFRAGGGGLSIDIFGCIEICAFGHCLLCCIGDIDSGCVIFTDPLPAF